MQLLANVNQNLIHKMTCTIDSEKINKAIEKELTNICKKISINGFRKGKVPIQIVSQRYKNSVTLDILNNFMTNNFIDLIAKQKINIIGSPKYIPGIFTENKDFEYVVEFNAYPIIDLKILKNISIEKPIVTITESDIDSTIENIKRKCIKWVEINSSVEKNDRVTIDFTSYIRGKEIKNGTTLGFVLPLGKGHMLSCFEEKIIGYKKGDNFIIDCSFPEDYHLKVLKGQRVHFNIKLKKVERPTVPELNKDLIKSLGIKDGLISSFRNKIRKNMELDFKIAMYKEIKNQIIKEILNLKLIDIPISLINYEIKDINKNHSPKSLTNQKKLENFQKITENVVIDKAKKNAAIKLILQNICSQHNIQADEKSIHEVIEELSHSYKDSKEVVNFYKKNDNIIDNIKNMIIEKKAIDIILKEAKVIEKKIDFNILMNQAII
ncbi:trigger factor [Pantoea sp. SoEX]|uniref:trigger factor n=1 Tax=Pantoea sp. SoEX TaxID=2576763 RepID=UPI00135B181B|nr:trigger factor [Pantoea sp. SoEX]MXP51367.1 trigger factor [Pantoea sp. SoEX]